MEREPKMTYTESAPSSTGSKSEVSKNDQRLRERYGPWAVVTGASDGIGRALAEALAAAGLNLVLVSRRAGALDNLARDLAVRAGIDARPLAADLATEAGVAAVVAGTAMLDVGLLVAAAGFGTSGDFVTAPLAEELTMLDVNCRAVTALAHHFAGRLAQRGRGGLVLLSSLLAFQGVPRAAHYAATKAYVQTLAEGLRGELRPHGVDVLAVAPGPVLSGFGRRADMRMTRGTTPEVVAAGALAALGRSATVRPGWLSKLLEFSLVLLPRVARSLILAQVMKGMTQHQVAAPLPAASRR